MHRCVLPVGLSAIGFGVSTLVLASMARAQDAPPVEPDPHGRVLFAPNLGLVGDPGGVLEVCTGWLPGGRRHCEPVQGAGEAGDRLAKQAGLTVQNAGDRETRLLAIYFGATRQPPEGQEPSSCGDCGLFDMVCSPPVAPGRTWTLPLRATGGVTPAAGSVPTAMASAVVYSLNNHPARDYGPDWVARLRAAGLDPDATVADAICHDLSRTIQHSEASDPAPACSAYRDFHRGYLDGPALDAGRGEAIAAVAAIPLPTLDERGQGRLDAPALDRYAAISLSETGFEEAGAPGLAYSSLAPGTYARTPEGQRGLVVVQNAGDGCATVAVDGFRSGRGPVGEAVTMTIAAGGWSAFLPDVAWPDVRGSLTLRVTGDQPVAAAATTLWFKTSATHTAVRERAGPVAWAVPRTYQPPGPPGSRSGATLDGTTARVAAMGRSAGVIRTGGQADADGMDAADGWETNTAIFNPTALRQLARLETQAPGVPPRDASYPIEPMTQVVMQLGLGLGLTGGGAGWGRLSGDQGPLAVSIESIRSASDVPAATEAWATSAWPYDPTGAAPGPRAFAIPDLGGPAVGGVAATSIVTWTAAMTDALVARLAVQSLYTGTARVAIDSFSPACGYIGGVERAVDRLQTLTLPVGELVGTRWGANAAMVRVLEGDVAVLVETARGERGAVAGAPPDLSSAYLGLGVDAPPVPPDLATATLAVTPTEIVLVDPPGKVDRRVALGEAGSTGRCLSVSAEGDAPWVALAAQVARVPGEIALSVDPGGLDVGTHVATITLRANEPQVRGSPATVRVVVRRRATAYLPAAFRE